MKLLMHVLKENKNLKINNERISYLRILNKLEEEYKELVIALIRYNSSRSLKCLKDVVRETFDLIQVCILILFKAHRQAKTLDHENLIKEINIEHKDKLVERGWIFKTGIEIDVKE